MKKYFSLGELLVDYREVFGLSRADLAARLETLLRPDKEICL